MNYMVPDPRTGEQTKCYGMASASVRVAEDHVVAAEICENGYVMLRTRIGAHEFKQLFSPGSVAAVAALFSALPGVAE